METGFTQKEYARLLELVHMGLWVAGAHNDEEPTPKRYEDIAQKVFSMADTFGSGKLVEKAGDGALGPSTALSEGPTMKIIDQFVDDSFWEELASRLAERDLLHEMGVTSLPIPLEEPSVLRLSELEDQYWTEFQEYGLARILLLKGGLG